MRVGLTVMMVAVSMRVVVLVTVLMGRAEAMVLVWMGRLCGWHRRRVPR